MAYLRRAARKGGASATQAAKTQGTGAVLAAKAVETHGEGSVLVAKAVETRGKCGVLHEQPQYRREGMNCKPTEPQRSQHAAVVIRPPAGSAAAVEPIDAP